MKCIRDFNGDRKEWEQYLRTYFAAMAMQGLLAESKINDATVAILAVDYADELIKRLNKEQSK